MSRPGLPAKLSSVLSTSEPGERSLSKPHFESGRRLERRFRCNLLIGAGCTIGSAPAGTPRAALTPAGRLDPASSRVPAASRMPAHPCRGAGRAQSRAALAWPTCVALVRTACTNEFHPEWLQWQGCPRDFGASG